jgi:S1-C subfamily serine protease
MATNPNYFLDRAHRTFGELAIGQALAKVRAIIGVPNVPQTEQAAQAALNKLQAGRQRPTANELAALEFVIRMMRPAPLSRNGRLDPLPAQPGSSVYQPALAQAWNQFCDKTKDIIYSVGRLDRTAGDNPQVGTGFLVTKDLVLTNHHVVSALSHGADELDEGMAVIRFYQEYEGPEPVSMCPIVKVVAVHPTLDMALLRVKSPGSRHCLRFAMNAPVASTLVATIGYPFQDDRNPLFVNAIYQSRYGVKRGAVGEIMGGQGHLLSHDCSTLGGNSGSPLLALDTAEVVGLHFTGEFMYRNEAIAAADVVAFIEQEASHD